MGLFSRKEAGKSKGLVWNQSEILAPVKGRLIPMAEVNDPVFSEEVIGKGAAVVPKRGRVVAPADGIVNLVFRTGHAIGMVTDGGTELMIHIGLETVRLNGRLFKPCVDQGSRVKAGDLLMEFDLEYIRANAASEACMAVFTGLKEGQEIHMERTGAVKALDEIAWY